MGSRVIAVVDAYDAMTSERPYQQVKSDAGARHELRLAAGTQFDPVVVDAFLAVLDERDRMGPDAAEHDEPWWSCPFEPAPACARARAPGAGRAAPTDAA